MHDISYRTLMRRDEFKYLLMMCAGVWIFASDRLMETTLLPDITREIGGANLISWGRTLFEAAAIVTGMLAAFLVRRWGVRFSFVTCGILFVFGCVVSAVAENMLVFQIGRFFQALAGSAFVSLTSIGITQMFPAILLARAGSIVAIVWGFAAFSGPLVGGLFSEYASWRSAFIYMSIFGSALSVSSFFVLGRQPILASPQTEDKAEPFPSLRMLVLIAGVMSIASGGISFSPVLTPALALIGIALLVVFILLDRAANDRRLLPTGVLKLNTKIGAAAYHVLALSASVVGISLLGPILMVVLYDLPPIQIGYMMFTTSLGWTLGEMVFSGTQPEREGRVIVAGAVLVLLAVIAFNLALYSSLTWFYTLGFFVEGIGLGMSWSLIARRAIADNNMLEKGRIAGSIHTLQRIGFSLGAASFGILANAQGFSETMSVATAFEITQWILGLSVPLAIAGLAAATVFAGARFNPMIDYAVEPVAPSSG